MTHVYIAQVLCPKRHAIIGHAFELSDELADDPAEREAVFTKLISAVDDASAAGMNPWCGICGAPRATWLVELGRTRWTSLQEAEPHLRENQRNQMLTRLSLDLEKAKASNN
jgi:hypothetical protein